MKLGAQLAKALPPARLSVGEHLPARHVTSEADAVHSHDKVLRQVLNEQRRDANPHVDRKVTGLDRNARHRRHGSRASGRQGGALARVARRILRPGH
jgi:hypothetical protein